MSSRPATNCQEGTAGGKTRMGSFSFSFFTLAHETDTSSIGAARYRGGLLLLFPSTTPTPRLSRGAIEIGTHHIQKKLYIPLLLLKAYLVLIIVFPRSRRSGCSRRPPVFSPTRKSIPNRFIHTPFRSMKHQSVRTSGGIHTRQARVHE